MKKIDFNLEGKKIFLGSEHPINKITQQILNMFSSNGYQIVEGEELEIEEYNFNKLNIPKNHPARNMHDTFYFNNSNFLLRTHTSNIQVRMMEKYPNKELKIISAGKVYRRDEDDNTHTHQFTQIEGFVVGKDVNFSNLKFTIEMLLNNIFGKGCAIRFRPSYFPFTNPSVEVDSSCFQCKGKGCNICKETGWIEILGAGLIDTKVLENCGFNNEIFTGFAFGLGVERLLMIKNKYPDIRDFYNNNNDFLKQNKN